MLTPVPYAFYGPSMMCGLFVGLEYFEGHNWCPNDKRHLCRHSLVIMGSREMNDEACARSRHSGCHLAGTSKIS